MEEKIGVVAVVVEGFDKTDRVNELLHEYREYIVGRLGIPFKTADGGHQRGDERGGRKNQRAFGQARHDRRRAEQGSFPLKKRYIFYDTYVYF